VQRTQPQELLEVRPQVLPGTACSLLMEAVSRRARREMCVTPRL
jgi:hypothetical protein